MDAFQNEHIVKKAPSKIGPHQKVGPHPINWAGWERKVYVIVEINGRYFIYNGYANREWPPSECTAKR